MRRGALTLKIRPPGRGLLSLGLLALSLGTGGCSGPSAEPPPLAVQGVVLITIDTLRADALGFAGNPSVETPALDRLAAAGRVFEHAHVHSVTTLPSHASLLTGLYPTEHGARRNGATTFDATVPTLASRLSAAGFRTAAFVSAFPLDRRFGLDRGFELYDDEFGAVSGGLLYAERAGDQAVTEALRWWRSRAGERRFLWLHLFEPHAPYDPPEPFATRYAADPYLGEVAAVDSYLQPFLSELEKSAGDTLVIFTSDHGEARGEHGEASHGLFAYEATLKVPLVLWGVGVEPARDRRPARLIDVFPTVLERLDLELPAGLPGSSLLAPAGAQPSSYFEALSAYYDYGWAPLRGQLRGGFKYLDLPLPELYDLAVDPRELSNLALDNRRLKAELAALLPDTGWPPADAAIAPENAARLRSLGYVGGDAGSARVFGPEDDPKNLLELDRRVQLMLDLRLAGHTEKAIAIGREVLAQRPTMTVVALHVGTFLSAIGKPEEAVEVLRRAAATPPLLRQLGLSLLAAGRPGEALRVLEPLADSAARNHRALALAYLGRAGEALASLEALAEEAPDEPLTFENLSYLALEVGRGELAAEHAERAVALDPGRLAAWRNLGQARYQSQQPQAALKAWRRALELAPRDWQLLLNVGLLERELGVADAVHTLRRFVELAPRPAYDPQRRQVEALLGG